MALYHLQKIDTQDVLLTISFPRYSADILRIMRFAKERGATNLSITDRPSSPLMSLADHTLFVPADHQILSGSLVPALALIEGMAEPERSIAIEARPRKSVSTNKRCKTFC